jgi:hypothetical protein
MLGSLSGFYWPNLGFLPYELSVQIFCPFLGNRLSL